MSRVSRLRLVSTRSDNWNRYKGIVSIIKFTNVENTATEVSVWRQDKRHAVNGSVSAARVRSDCAPCRLGDCVRIVLDLKFHKSLFSGDVLPISFRIVELRRRLSHLSLPSVAQFYDAADTQPFTPVPIHAPRAPADLVNVDTQTVDGRREILMLGCSLLRRLCQRRTISVSK